MSGSQEGINSVRYVNRYDVGTTLCVPYTQYKGVK